MKKVSVCAILVLCHSLWFPVEAMAVTLTGTAGDDVILGGRRADRLGGGGGFDRIFGKSNPRPRTVDGERIVPVDRLVGAGDFDGGPGRDKVLGDGLVFDDDGTGGDIIKGMVLVLGADGGRDVVRCVNNVGVAFVDHADTVSGCGIVVRQSAGFVQSALGASIFIPFYGTNGSEALAGDNLGTFGSPVVFGRAGNDSIQLAQSGFALGGAGSDVLTGSAQGDTLVDGDGTPGDSLNGGGGADTIYAADGAPGPIDCGAGDAATDLVVADPDDVPTNCGSDTVKAGTNTVM